MSYFDDMEEADHQRYLRSLTYWERQVVRSKYQTKHQKRKKAKKPTYTYMPLFPV